MNFKKNVSASKFFLSGSALLAGLSLVSNFFSLKLKEFSGQNLEDLGGFFMTFGIGFLVLGLLSWIFSYFSKKNNVQELQGVSLVKENFFFSNTGLIIITFVFLAVSFIVGLGNALSHFN